MPTAEEVKRIAAQMRQAGARPTPLAPTADEVRAVARARQESTQGAPSSAGSSIPDIPPPQTEPSELDPYAEAPRVPTLEAVGSSLARVGASIVEPPVRTYAGLRRTLRRALPEAVQAWDTPAQARVDALEKAIQSTAEEAHPVAQTVGGIAGETAALGAPMAAAGQWAARALPRAARRAPRLLRTTGEATGAALTEAARAPEGERWSRARDAFLATFGGAAVARTAERALGGVAKTQAAEEMIDRGVPLTPGQAARGRVVRFAEDVMSDIPGPAGKIRRMRARSTQAWNRNLLQDVIPDIPAAEGMSITRAGTEGFQQAQRHFGRLYDDVFRETSERVGANPMLLSNLQAAVNRTTSIAERSLGRRKGRRYSEWLQTEMDKVRFGTPQRLQEFNTAIRDRISELRLKPKRGSRAEIDMLNTVSNSFENVVGPRISDLRRIERGYAGLSVLQKAASYAGAVKEGLFTPSNLTNAMKAKGTERAVSAGQARLQQAAARGREVIGDLPPPTTRLIRGATTLGVLAGGYLNPALMGGVIATTPAMVSNPVRRIMTGQMEMTPEVADLLMRWGSRAGAGTAAAQREE